MLNKYPLWKYLLVLIVVLLGIFYAAPNLYKPDPALQIVLELTQGNGPAGIASRLGCVVCEFGTALAVCYGYR